MIGSQKEVSMKSSNCASIQIAPGDLMSLYQYKTYGLVIHSEVKIEGLTSEPSQDTPDVKIRLGKLDVTQHTLIKGFLIKEVTPNGFLYGIKDLATFLISDGKQIIVDPLSPEPELWQMYLLGSVMGALLQQRGFLTLHGSAFLHDNKAHLILGASGMGKSSIAMALHQKGHEFLTDDICAIKFNEAGIPNLYYGSRHIKLWEDAIEHLETAREGMSRVRENLPKFRLLLEEGEHENTHILGHIFMLNITRLDDDTVAFTKLNAIEKLQLLNLNLYRKQFLQDMGLEKNAFHMLSQLANNASGIVLNRTHSRTDVRLVAQRIEDFLIL